jgi:hypothetical protein
MKEVIIIEMVDKINLLIIAFITICIILAGLMVTGTVPEIFHTGSIANETKYESKNQTKMLVDFIALYLANIDKETKRTAAELAAAKVTLENQEQSLRNQEQSLINQGEILYENRNITQDILKISQEHKDVAQGHDILQKKGDNLTEEIANLTLLNYKMLNQHTVNMTNATTTLLKEEGKK